ncbi:MAG TPA: isochorismatase family cysteine hydrolase [Nitrososphaerales archaeon]|nr:isochorismatase family cysteine hydrolase [Nitrososphaerales archaeon]
MSEPNRGMKQGEFTEKYLLQKARRDYDEGIASFKIDRRRTALIVVDMIEEFTKPEYCPAWVPEATRQLPKIKKLIDACRKVRVPVIYTCYAMRGSFDDANPYFRNAWTPIDKFDDYDGPPLFTKESIDQMIKPDYERDYIIAKPSYGAFTNTTLDYILKNLGVDTVIICGTMTNYCCGTTARDAHARGYKVVFGSDINSTDDPDIQKAELKTLRRGFALVIESADIEEAIEGKGKYSEMTS